MKYIKTFDKPQIDDYVICTEGNITKPQKQIAYIENIIGQITNIINSLTDQPRYIIEYKNLPANNLLYFRDLYKKINNRHIISVAKNEILHYSKTKKPLQLILTANKYNL